MSTWRRIGYAIFSTIALMMGGLVYNEVFIEQLLPLVDTGGKFGTPVLWLERLVPIVLLVLLLAVWTWVIAGAVQDERTVTRRRRVR